jgi:hypothetical protein
MLGFTEWLHNEEIQKKRKKNGEQHGNQGSRKVGDVDHQGQVNRPHQEIHSTDIHVFPEP